MKASDKVSAMPIGRRRFIAGATAAGAAAAVGLRAPAILAQSTKPLKIGCLNSFSKAFAVPAANNFDGMALWFDQHGNKAGGRPIEIVKEDDEINPQVALEKLRKMVQSDQIDLLVGPQASNVAMAIVDFVKTNKVFWICSGAGTTALTWNRIPYLFRTSCTSWQHSYAIGNWFYDNISHEAVGIASDYAGGHDVVGEFKNVFGKRGRITKEIYPPLNTSDYSPYLTEMRSLDAKGAYAFFAGSDAVRFVGQYTEMGLKGRTKLCCSGYMVEADALPSQGDAALGILSSLHYADGLDTAENKKFLADYQVKYKAVPSVYSEQGYVTARVITDALAVVGGDTSDKDKLAAAVVALKFNAPRGPFSFDPVTHNAISNVYIREVVKRDGRLSNVPIATFENVRDPGVKGA